MNEKKNFIYAISANLLSTLVSAFITLLLPRNISVSAYGYFQYYLFWAGYLGVLHLGWIDGLYLVHCGEFYNELDKQKLSAQFRTFIIFQIFLAVIVVLAALRYTQSVDYRFIFICIGVLIVVTNARMMFLYILQASARIRDYSVATISGLVVYLLAVSIMLLFGVKDYKYYILANIFSLLVPLAMGMYFCRDIIKTAPSSIKESLMETADYIRVGSKLLIANFASLWIIGVVRLMVEQQWDISTFGKISLTITISNMFMTFINAVALVLLPMLRRMESQHIFDLYKQLNTALLTTLFGGMILYYPAERVLTLWLPEYADSLVYMALLFPICVFESKNALILNTYLKALRQEKAIMIVNVIAVMISATLSAFSVYVLKNLTLTMLFIVIAIGGRCIGLEIYLSSKAFVPVVRVVIVEILMSVLFIVCNWVIGGEKGLGIYIFIFITYVLLEHNNIKYSFRKLRGKI